MDQFIMGAIAMGSWVAGLYFFRFWRDTRDRLFAMFGISFWLLGITRIALAATASTSESHTELYFIRLLAFVIILVAILDKNRPSRSPAGALRNDAL